MIQKQCHEEFNRRYSRQLGQKRSQLNPAVSLAGCMRVGRLQGMKYAEMVLI